MNSFISENSKCFTSALSEQSFYFFLSPVFKDFNATKWPFLFKNCSQLKRKTQLINKNDKKHNKTQPLTSELSSKCSSSEALNLFPLLDFLVQLLN